MHESQEYLKAINAKAYLELHIEQGPVLESMNKSDRRCDRHVRR